LKEEGVTAQDWELGKKKKNRKEDVARSVINYDGKGSVLGGGTTTDVGDEWIE
jgi:hypothetical protein